MPPLSLEHWQCTNAYCFLRESPRHPSSSSIKISSKYPDRHRHGPAAAEAEGSESEPFPPLPKGVDQGHDNTCAARTDRVAEGNGPTVDIDDAGVETELSDHRQRLRGEGLVFLDQIE